MTDTFSVAGSPGWTQIATGATHARVGVQVASVHAVHVLIGTAAPAEAATGYIVLSHAGTRELDVNLAGADLMFARAPDGGDIVLRGFRETA